MPKFLTAFLPCLEIMVTDTNMSMEHMLINTRPIDKPRFACIMTGVSLRSGFLHHHTEIDGDAFCLGFSKHEPAEVHWLGQHFSREGLGFLFIHGPCFISQTWPPSDD